MSSDMKAALAILGRAFAIAALAVFLDKGADIFAFDVEAVKAAVAAGVASVAWTAFSWLNPLDKRLGVGSVSS